MKLRGTYPCFPKTFLTTHQSSSSPLTISTVSPGLSAISSSNSGSNFHRERYSADSGRLPEMTMGTAVAVEDCLVEREEEEEEGAGGGVYWMPNEVHMSCLTCSRDACWPVL
jgi:hypothetical protein